MKPKNSDIDKDQNILEMTVKIVSSFVSNNAVATSDMPTLIKSVHSAISTLDRGATDTPQPPEPAVPIAVSVTNDHIICLEDGRQLKMLKRYLSSQYDMSPEEYRARWGLPDDYPMVAPNYAKQRSEFAKKIGLGKKKTR